ncbi:putative tricarboxylic acid cycle-related protein [Dioszegia hungarica]|uniref:Dihydrolipoamide acetyltransferase component of pyruvate dehydrogenase complex n=1 Tax=Dioszegia hungarica TaxID=4972 RepID=A0AA38H346_9TREE|nr:putative tricarboxylic acid cycle-related protein [Dioszegia hungarica]KAI9633188.1 putative tricarboxylic acid cycle-related protein [Dioszegia hungarica]
MLRRISALGRGLPKPVRSTPSQARTPSPIARLVAGYHTLPRDRPPLSPRITGRLDLQPLPRLFHSSAIRRADEPFKLADIGEGITEVEIISWSVKEGDMVEEFDTLCEVQSDKSTVELTAPFTGKIHHIAFNSGEMVKVGQVLCRIMTEGGASEDVPAEVEQSPEPAETSEVASSSPSPLTESVNEPSSDHISPSSPSIPERQIVHPQQHPSSASSDMDRALLASLQAAAEATAAAEAATEAAGLLQHRDEGMEAAGGGGFSGEAGVVRGHEPKPVEISTAPVPARRERVAREGQREIVKTSPAVRTLAARLGVRLEDVKPTGEGGRVTQVDVQAAAERHAPVASSSRAASLPTSPAPLGYPAVRSKMPEVTKVDFGRTRKVMYRAMGDMASVPHFGYSHTLNLTPLLPYLRALNAPASPSSTNYLASDIPAEHARNPIPISPKQKTTLLSFLVKGLLLAMEEHPIMRARAKEDGNRRTLEIARDGVIGVAVSDPKYGLVTPSLPSMPPSAPLSALTSALTALRQNPTKPSSPANLTISSVGGLGEGRGMMPVLPPGGGVAICAVGRAKWEMEWKNGSGKGIMDMMPEEVESGGMKAVLRVPVGWSGDHRVLEGAELIAFTETWKKYIEEPWRWLNID